MSKEIQDTKKLDRLNFLEKVCKDGRIIFMITGAALAEIKEQKLYELKGFKTFINYAKSIGYTERYCNQLIVSSKATKELPESLQKFIQSESAARALSKIPESLRIEVAENATEKGTKPATAKSIKKSYPPAPPKPPKTAPEAPLLPEDDLPDNGPFYEENESIDKPSTILTDSTGLPIPLEILPLWKSFQEIEPMLNSISQIRSMLKKAKEESDLLFTEMDLTNDQSILNQLYTDFKRAKPYAVCPSCQGISVALTKSCLTCKGRGFVSQFYWENCITEETRNFRAKAKKK
jgi:hypothetical protein